MASAKAYTLIFLGDEAENAQKETSTMFIDGGLQDTIIELLAGAGIKATRSNWGQNHMSFLVEKK